MIPLVLLYSAAFPTALEWVKSYIIVISLLIGIFFIAVGYWRGWRMPRSKTGRDIPENIQCIANTHCYVLHRISPQEYSKIAEFHLKKIGDPNKYKENPVVFTVFAFEPCEIWQILEQEYNKTSTNTPTLTDLLPLANQHFPHFKQFSNFRNKYSESSIKRVLLLHDDWYSRNETKHFDLFENLNGKISCTVFTRGTLKTSQITFLTDYALVGDVLLDCYEDSETLIITYLDARQNPQVSGYLLDDLKSLCVQNNSSQSLSQFRTTKNV
jgi:hypothetical protein